MSRFLSRLYDAPVRAARKSPTDLRLTVYRIIPWTGDDLEDVDIPWLCPTASNAPPTPGLRGNDPQ